MKIRKKKVEARLNLDVHNNLLPQYKNQYHEVYNFNFIKIFMPKFYFLKLKRLTFNLKIIKIQFKKKLSLIVLYSLKKEE